MPAENVSGSSHVLVETIHQKPTDSSVEPLGANLIRFVNADCSLQFLSKHCTLIYPRTFGWTAKLAVGGGIKLHYSKGALIVSVSSPQNMFEYGGLTQKRLFIIKFCWLSDLFRCKYPTNILYYHKSTHSSASQTVHSVLSQLKMVIHKHSVIYKQGARISSGDISTEK